MPNTISIIVADQDPLTLRKVEEASREYVSVVTPCASKNAILDALRNDLAPVLVLALEKPFETAFDLLSEIKSVAPRTEIVFVSRFDDETLWIEAIQRGAYDYLAKPLDPSELRRVLLQAAEKNIPFRIPRRPPAGSVKVKAASERAS